MEGRYVSDSLEKIRTLMDPVYTQVSGEEATTELRGGVREGDTVINPDNCANPISRSC